MTTKAICCGGTPTERDLKQLAMFRDYLEAYKDAEAAGYSRGKAMKVACLDVYGDEFGEGNGNQRKDHQG